jgi:hypothetical protein
MPAGNINYIPKMGAMKMTDHKMDKKARGPFGPAKMGSYKMSGTSSKAKGSPSSDDSKTGGGY